MPWTEADFERREPLEDYRYIKELEDLVIKIQYKYVKDETPENEGKNLIIR